MSEHEGPNTSGTSLTVFLHIGVKLKLKGIQKGKESLETHSFCQATGLFPLSEAKLSWPARMPVLSTIFSALFICFSDGPISLL